MQVNTSLDALEWPPRTPDLAILDFFHGQEYIKNKIWDAPQPQQPVTIQRLSVTTVREGRIMWALDTKRIREHCQPMQKMPKCCLKILPQCYKLSVNFKFIWLLSW